MNNSNPTLKKAYKLLKKITKKLGNSNLYFSAQIGVDSSKDERIPTYAAMIEAPAEGLEPIYFASLDKEEFLQKIEDFLNGKATVNNLAIAFHEAQIESNNRSIEHHQGKIDSLKELDDIGGINELKQEIETVNSDIDWSDIDLDEVEKEGEE